MRSKSLAQPSAGYTHCLPLSFNVTSKSRKALTVGAAMLAALFSVTAANAQGLIQVPVITTYAGNGSLTNEFSGDGGQAALAGINNPEGIAYDGKGNTYIADYGNNRIRVVSATGIINTVFGTGAACPAGAGNPCGDGGAASAATFNNPSAMQFDAKGDLYIADYGDQRVRKITATNGTITGASIVTTVAGTGATGTTGEGVAATTAELNNPHGLALDSAGDLYIAEQQGCVIRYVPAVNQTVVIGGAGVAAIAGDIYTVVGKDATCGYISDTGGIQGTATELNAPTNVALDPAGDLYIGDYKNGRVRLWTKATGVITTIAGTAYQACPVIAPTAAAPNPIPPCGDGGLATAAALNGPTGVYADAAGNVIIGDAFGARVREINANTKIISTIAGDSQQCTNITQTVTNAVYPVCGDGGAATNALVSFPILISVNPFGNIFYVDQYDNKVREIIENTVFPDTVIGTKTPPSQNILLQVTGTTGQTLTINSISVPVSQSGIPEYTVTGVTGCNATGGAANAVGTICTVGVTFNPAFPGNQNQPLVVNTSKGTFSFALNGVGVGPQAILSPGVLSTVAGTGVAGPSSSGASATTATLNAPSRVSVDTSGNIYISDTANNVISAVFEGGSGLAALIALEDGGAVAKVGDIYTLAGTGTACAAPTATPACGDGGLATAATLNAPTDVWIDGAGNLFISDSKDNRVREVLANTGIITTVAGNGAPAFSADGVAPTATGIGTPTRTVTDANGNLYIVAQSDNAIRFVPNGGFIRTIVGTEGVACAPPTTSSCGDGGLATAATLNAPSGLGRDLNGNLYITDTGDNRIRFVNMASGVITTIAGTGAAGYTGDGGLGTNATLNNPYALAVDSAGDLFIADQGNKVIREVTASTLNILTLAGNGTACATATGVCGDGGADNVAAFITPKGVSVDSMGALYVSDAGENRIRKAVGNPTVLTFPATVLGTTSTLTSKLNNIGNGTLTLSDVPAPNPSVSANFNLGNTSTCPTLTTTTATLASGANCGYVINFAPLTAAGAYTGQLIETDNSLNATNATQIINFNATASQVPSTSDTLTAVPNPTSYGTPDVLTFCIPVVTGVAVPAGSVVFSYGTPAVTINPGTSPVTIGTTPTTFNGQSCYLATTTTANLPVGTDTITATFTATPASGYASGAPTAIVPVAKAPVIQPPGGPTALSQTFTATPNSQVFGMPVLMTYTVPVAVGNVPPTGPVVFTFGTTNLGTCTVFTAGTTVNGVTPYSCALSTTVLPVGPDTLTATYTTTDPNYAGGTATPAPPPLTAGVTITAGAAMATLTAGPNPTTYGTTVTITETLVPINGICPTAPVSFYSGGTVTNGVNTGGTLIATSGGTTNPATVTAIPAPGTATSCVATIQTNSLPVGTTDVTATAPANGSFAAVGSGPLPVIINQDAAADTLATTPNPSTFGQPVTITDTIPNAPNGTAPTGTVQFYDYATPIGTPQPVTAGVATLVTSTLPVGTDSITGVYSGDTNFAKVTSNAVNQIVNAVPTTPTLSAAPNPTTFGTQVTIQETIPVVNGTAPTGVVSFYYELPGSATQVPIGTFNLTAGSGGVATVTTTTLPVGVDNLFASYAGDGNYAAVTSGPDPETVNKGIGPDTLAVAPNPSQFGSATPVIATDTIPTVGGVAPTGTVTFYDNGPTGTNLGTFPVVNGVATLSTTTLPVGTQPITAVYNGDGNYGVVTSNQVNEVIAPGNTVPALSANPNPTTFGTLVTLTESIPGINGVVPTGTVTFTYTAPGSVTVVPIAANVTVTNGVATTTISTLPIGVDKVTAVYSGDTNYATATNTANVTVGLATGTDTISGNPNPANSGVPVTFTFTVPVVNGVTPTGTVTFYNGTTPITGTTTPFNAAGQTTLTTSTLPIGPDSITGKYPGDNTYAAGTATTVETINAVAGGDTVTAAPNPTTYGAPDVLTFCIPVVGGAAAPTGTVTFSVGGTTINTPVTIAGTATNGCYVATTTTSNLPVGNPTTVTGTFTAGPTSGYASAAPTTPVVVGPAPLSNDAINATPNPQTVALPVTLTFSIPVAVGNAAPTGSVTFTSGGVTQGTAAVTFTAGTTTNGITTYTATTTTTTLPVGTDTITGTYTGDTNYAGGPLTTPETINAISGGGDTVTVAPNPTVFGSPVTITFCIPAVAGSGSPTGTVTFSTGGTTINTPVTIGTTVTNGCYVATTTTSGLPVGAPTTVTGTYTPGPTSPYGPAAPTGTVTVTPVNPPSVVTYGPTNPTCSVTLVTLTDTITPVNGVIPTGTVQFYTNAGPLGAPVTITAANNGIATLQIALPCGTTGIYAIFTGLTPYGTSTAPTVPLNLADFTIAATPPTQTVNPGDTAVYTVSLAGAGGVAYTSPVTLTATGLPPGATVAFGTTTYVPGVGPTPTSMTIVTSPTVAMVKPTRGGRDIYYGLLLLPLLGIRRIRKKIRALPRGIAYGLAALVVLAGLGAMTGCQGGYFGGPPQTYVITVTGTSGTLSHSTTVTLTVE